MSVEYEGQETHRVLKSLADNRDASVAVAAMAKRELVLFSRDLEPLLYRPLCSRYEGYADLRAPLQSREKLRIFEEIWQQAEPDPEFRRLGI